MILTGNGGTPSFGGIWTIQKLDILERYLNTYTTALKNQLFDLVYVDAFAGTGQISPTSGSDAEADALETRAFIMGSAERALLVEDRPFDRLVFVEADPERSRSLEGLQFEYRDRRIDVLNADANEFLRGLRRFEYGNWRGVLFVDPFGTQFDWSTAEKIAALERLDMWLLVPTSSIGRMLPRSRDPSDVDPGWETRLNRVYGGDGWRNLYHPASQIGMFDESGTERDAGVEGLLAIYKEQLRDVFGNRLLEQSLSLLNSRGSPLFELIFCAGHSSPKAISAAHGIAKHLIESNSSK